MGLVNLTIDGQAVTVAPGTTILAAAAKLGIEIPTLCHVEGLEPSASCFVCAVQVAGLPYLSPACAMPVADGMVITTNSSDVRAARRIALELLLSDHAGDCIAPCRATCPAGLDIPGFVHALAAGQNRRATEIIADRLALPGALGRICPRLCEHECRRSAHDEGLAIAALHRFAADRELASADPFVPPRAAPSGKRVGIVGAGPAGLTAAYYLLQMGHACTLFDAHPLPGGMLRYGIPEYRLPKAALDGEIEIIKRLGAEFRMNSHWGTDFTLTELRAQFDAVFLGIGAQRSQNLGCEGDKFALSGIEFLALGATGGLPASAPKTRVDQPPVPPIGDDVVVIGGGNTAMDTARTAIRLGAKHVRVLYRRTRTEMPCLMEEVEAAEAEGVRIEYLVAPTRLERKDGRTLRLTCQHMQLGEPDASGRRRPMPIAGSQFTIEASAVIAAIGQAVDRSLGANEGLKVTAWGIAADPKTLATNLPGVFAGGDGVSGADLAVSAAAAGRLAATSIDQYLRGQPAAGSPEMINVQMRAMDEQELAALFRQIEKTPRVRGRRIDVEQRKSSSTEVEAGLSETQAIEEARRCLTCGCRKAENCRVRRYATEYGVDPYRFSGERRRFSQDLSHPEIIYEPGKCIMCEACVRIAAEAREELGLAIVGRGFHVTMKVPFDRPLSDGLRRVAARCAEACPTGALALRTERACDLTVCGHPRGDT
jgi:formate dehydrogenase major subunit